MSTNNSDQGYTEDAYSDMDKKEFVIKLASMKQEAGKLKMYKTMHSLDDTISIAGWELAKHLESDSKGDIKHINYPK